MAAEPPEPSEPSEPSAAAELVEAVEDAVASQLHPFGSYVAHFDATVDRGLDRCRGHPLPETLFRTASRLGEWSLLWHAIGVAIAVVDPPRARRSARLAVLLGAESLVVNQGIKRLFARARPTVAGDPRHRLRQPRTSSFPSGHASSGFFAATILSGTVPRLRPLWYAAAVVVAVSRPYVRVHHASDVVAGAAVGRILAEVAERVWPECRPGGRR
jgi:membrane-associated phospholipid phosphatase